jgi:guanylate kinase
MSNSAADAQAGVQLNADVHRRGLMLVLSSPSGAGKTSISRAVLERDQGIELSVSMTTRPKRPGEVAGVHYHFTDKQAFGEMVNRRELLEYAQVFGHFYGTPRRPVDRALAEGRDMLFDIDWQGTQQIAESARDDLVSIFILPPSTAELERRLHRRAQDPDDVVADRMRKASDEMSHYAEYDYIVVNADFEDSVASVQAILRAERLRRHRQVGLRDFVKGLREGQ